MVLKIEVPLGKGLFLRGMVLRFPNAPGRVKILVEGRGAILPEDMVMAQPDATKPLEQFYLGLQTAYIGESEDIRRRSRSFLAPMMEALSEEPRDERWNMEQRDAVAAAIGREEFYKALRIVGRMIGKVK